VLLLMSLADIDESHFPDPWRVRVVGEKRNVETVEFLMKLHHFNINYRALSGS